MNRNVTLTQETPTVAAWQLYLAAAFGAFCLGFGDLVKNGQAATVLKIADVIHEHLFPGFGVGAAVALVLLIGLGVGYCWIQGPGTLVDAFNRGFSVFAVLAVVTATDAVPAGLSAPTAAGVRFRATPSLIAPAYAQENIGSELRLSAEPIAPLGQAIIQITTLKGKAEMPVITVTLREAETRKVIGLEQVRGATLHIQRPPGKYLLEVETPGYRRTEVMCDIDDQINAYALSLPETEWPLSIQRLYGATSGRLEALPPAERFKLIGTAYFRARNYAAATRYYDKALSEQKDDVQLYNFKGYSLFRAGKYAEALGAFTAAAAINPNDLMVRLNMAKVHCAQKQPALALAVLEREPHLSPDEVRVMVQDGELLRVCKNIRSKLVEWGG